MLKVLIAVGGSGGHLFPARQLAAQIPGCEVLFAGHGLAKSPFFDQALPFVEIVSTASKRNLFVLLKGFFQACRLLRRFRPDVVVGFGSFHAFPLLMAALFFRKKIVLFEANASLGQVNRFFAPWAEKVALQFPIRCRKAVYVPLLPWGAMRPRTKSYKKESGRVAILVFGGSQGAQFINRTFCRAARQLTFPFEVIHLTGKEDREITYAQPALVKPFEEEMAAAYEWADLAVCRCGAGTTAELIRYQLPAVVIPYPYARDHQRKNGEFLGQGARLLDQREATVERLVSEIEALKQNLARHKEALRQMNWPDTIQLGELVQSIGAKQ